VNIETHETRLLHRHEHHYSLSEAVILSYALVSLRKRPSKLLFLRICMSCSASGARSKASSCVPDAHHPNIIRQRSYSREIRLRGRKTGEWQAEISAKIKRASRPQTESLGSGRGYGHDGRENQIAVCRQAPEMQACWQGVRAKMPVELKIRRLQRAVAGSRSSS
jgi:hypothetical protein